MARRDLPSRSLGQQDERPEALLQSARVCSNIRTSERERKQKRRRGLPDRGSVPDPLGSRSRTHVSRWRADGHDPRRGRHRPGCQPPHPPLEQHHGLGLRGPIRGHRARPVLHPHDLGGLPVAHGLESPIGWPLHRVRELRRSGQGPDAPPGVHEHVSPRPDVPADRPGGRARRGDPAEPEDQAHRLLPHLLPGAVRRVGGGRGPAVRVHLRSQLRDRERRTAGGGAAAPGLSPGPLRGPGRAGDRVLLDPVRLQHRDLPRGAPGHPPGGPGGGVDRWRGQMGQVLARHRADHPAGDDLPAGVGPHRRVPVLRPGLHDHEGRPPQLDADARRTTSGSWRSTSSRPATARPSPTSCSSPA